MKEIKKHLYLNLKWLRIVLSRQVVLPMYQKGSIGKSKDEWPAVQGFVSLSNLETKAAAGVRGAKLHFSLLFFT